MVSAALHYLYLNNICVSTCFHDIVTCMVIAGRLYPIFKTVVPKKYDYFNSYLRWIVHDRVANFFSRINVFVRFVPLHIYDDNRSLSFNSIWRCCISWPVLTAINLSHIIILTKSSEASTQTVLVQNHLSDNYQIHWWRGGAIDCTLSNPTLKRKCRRRRFRFSAVTFRHKIWLFCTTFRYHSPLCTKRPFMMAAAEKMSNPWNMAEQILQNLS